MATIDLLPLLSTAIGQAVPPPGAGDGFALAMDEAMGVGQPAGGRPDGRPSDVTQPGVPAPSGGPSDMGRAPGAEVAVRPVRGVARGRVEQGDAEEAGPAMPRPVEAVEDGSGTDDRGALVLPQPLPVPTAAPEAVVVGGVAAWPNGVRPSSEGLGEEDAGQREGWPGVRRVRPGERAGAPAAMPPDAGRGTAEPVVAATMVHGEKPESAADAIGGAPPDPHAGRPPGVKPAELGDVSGADAPALVEPAPVGPSPGPGPKVRGDERAFAAGAPALDVSGSAGAEPGLAPGGERRDGLAGQPIPAVHAPALPVASEAEPSSPARAPPMRQVEAAVVQLVRGQGGDTLTIRLDPGGLGRVQVRIDRADGAPRVVVAVERADTLMTLSRDQPQLERALDAAGVAREGRVVAFSLGLPDAPSPAPAAAPIGPGPGPDPGPGPGPGLGQGPSRALPDAGPGGSATGAPEAGPGSGSGATPGGGQGSGGSGHGADARRGPWRAASWAEDGPGTGEAPRWRRAGIDIMA